MVELGLQRLDWLYCFYRVPQDRSLVHGYLLYHDSLCRITYGFFVVFVYVTLLLIDMQVDLANEVCSSVTIFKMTRCTIRACGLLNRDGINRRTSCCCDFHDFIFYLVATLLYRRQRERNWSASGKASSRPQEFSVSKCSCTPA